jgi:hypothetical protein
MVLVYQQITTVINRPAGSTRTTFATLPALICNAFSHRVCKHDPCQAQPSSGNYGRSISNLRMIRYYACRLALLFAWQFLLVDMSLVVIDGTPPFRSHFLLYDGVWTRLRGHSQALRPSARQNGISQKRGASTANKDRSLRGKRHSDQLPLNPDKFGLLMLILEGDISRPTNPRKR